MDLLQYMHKLNKKEAIMTREELAKELNVSLRTISNWEKEKPNLVKIINQGLMIDNQIKEAEQHLKKLKEMKDKANSGKFQLK